MEPGADHVRYVAIGDNRLRLARTNIGRGKPLILLNGIGAAIEMWQPFIAELDQREAICLDLPGCGASPPARLPMTMSAIAAIVVGVMDALQIPSADVLGYSFGGAVALQLAHRFPDRVRRLVLASTTPGIPAAMPHPAVTALMLSPLRYYNSRAAKLIIPIIAGGRTSRDAAQLQHGLAQRLERPPSVRGYAYQLVAISTFTAWPWLHRITHPTLIVHGRDDPVTPAMNARMMSATMPNAALHIVPGGGHLLLLDDPTRVAPAILRFLRG
jgi:pimeloyl-ACP methyl ester carboxylesterase